MTFILLIISYNNNSVKFHSFNPITDVINKTKDDYINITKEKHINITKDEISIITEEKKNKISKNKTIVKKKDEKTNKNIKKRVGVIGVDIDQNPGNNLIKYSIFTILKEYGFDPIIIARIKKNNRIDFLRRTVKLKIIEKSYSELKKEDYDILTVIYLGHFPKKYIFMIMLFLNLLKIGTLRNLSTPHLWVQ